MRYATVVLSLVFAAACADPNEPRQPEYDFRFNVSEADSIVRGDTVIFTRGRLGDLDELWPVDAEATADGIRVTGSFVAPCSGPLPDGHASAAAGQEISLQVSWPPEAIGSCADAPQPWIYEARYSGLPTGRYTVTVAHTGDLVWAHGEVESRPEELVLDTEISR